MAHSLWPTTLQPAATTLLVPSCHSCRQGVEPQCNTELTPRRGGGHERAVPPRCVNTSGRSPCRNQLLKHGVRGGSRRKKTTKKKRSKERKKERRRREGKKGGKEGSLAVLLVSKTAREHSLYDLPVSTKLHVTERCGSYETFEVVTGSARSSHRSRAAGGALPSTCPSPRKSAREAALRTRRGPRSRGCRRPSPRRPGCRQPRPRTPPR